MAPRLMQGSDAVADAAILAGCRFFTGYPMLPFTELLENMAKKLPAAGGVCINAESEIEGINMALGAAATGARAATGSCGQGVSLMQEGIAELALNELPLVVFTMARGQQDYFQCTRGGGLGRLPHHHLGPQGHSRGGGPHPGALLPGRPLPHPGHPLRRLRHRAHVGRHRDRADGIRSARAQGLGTRRHHERDRTGPPDLDLEPGQAQHARSRPRPGLEHHRREVRPHRGRPSNASRPTGPTTPRC